LDNGHTRLRTQTIRETRSLALPGLHFASSHAWLDQ
jgi:hypothetical protein